MKSKVYCICVIILALFVNKTVSAQDDPFYDIGYGFMPYGYMGCVDRIKMNPQSTDNPHSAPTCFKIEFLTSCDSPGYAGSYWLNMSGSDGDNWGQYPGMDLSNRGFTKLTFWARGLNGGELITFGSGGIDKTRDRSAFYKYKDSYGDKNIPELNKKIRLTNEWKQYSMDLSERDLSSVIGAFFWSASWNDNSKGLTFFLDDIRFEK